MERTPMKKLLNIVAVVAFLLSGWATGQDNPVVILAEPGFPAADSAVASPQQLAGWLRIICFRSTATGS